MAIKITDVAPGSASADAGIQPDDCLIAVNGHTVRDEIDFQFHSGEDDLTLDIVRNDTSMQFSMIREPFQSTGLSFAPMSCHACGNKCIFCFVDQNPRGMRKSLMFKDEDYRLSFLHGNYVTLTHMKQSDLERIAKQRLSPLYLSIHATDRSMRKKLLNIATDDHLMEKIAFFFKHRIEMHGQIVLCPELNDGPVLEKTIRDLMAFFPAFRSLSIVPVGLTQHREKLTRIVPVDSARAASVIQQVSRLQDEFLKSMGQRFVYLSDEFFLLAGEVLPETDYYDEFWQIENGVGLTRSFLDEFARIKPSIPKEISCRKGAWICGTLIAPVLAREVLPSLRAIYNFDIDLVPVPNRFYGESITVTGLLTGRDIVHTLKEKSSCETVYLPRVCLNADNLFLDDMTLPELAETLHCRVTVLDHFNNFWKN